MAELSVSSTSAFEALLIVDVVITISALSCSSVVGLSLADKRLLQPKLLVTQLWGISSRCICFLNFNITA